MEILFRIKRLFKDICMNIKFFIQRGRRGYADIDIWDISYWFERTFIPMLKELKDIKHGYPMTFKNEEEWDKELDKMIYYFTEMSEDECSQKNQYSENFNKLWFSDNIDKDLQKKYLDREKEICEYREDMKNKGFELLSKYYWNLWD